MQGKCEVEGSPLSNCAFDADHATMSRDHIFHDLGAEGLDMRLLLAYLHGMPYYVDQCVGLYRFH